jgi:hypothetical protein
LVFDRHRKHAHTAEDKSVKSHDKSICQSSARCRNGPCSEQGVMMVAVPR